MPDLVYLGILEGIQQGFMDDINKEIKALEDILNPPKPKFEVSPHRPEPKPIRQVMIGKEGTTEHYFEITPQGMQEYQDGTYTRKVGKYIKGKGETPMESFELEHKSRFTTSGESGASIRYLTSSALEEAKRKIAQEKLEGEFTHIVKKAYGVPFISSEPSQSPPWEHPLRKGIIDSSIAEGNCTFIMEIDENGKRFWTVKIKELSEGVGKWMIDSRWFPTNTVIERKGNYIILEIRESDLEKAKMS